MFFSKEDLINAITVIILKTWIAVANFSWMLIKILFIWGNNTFKNGLIQHFADEYDNPFKNDMYNKAQFDQTIKSPLSNYMYTPISNFGINDQGVDDSIMLSPTLGIKKKIEFGTPINKHLNQA